MTDNHRPPQIPAVNIRRQEASQGLRDRPELSGAIEVEQEEDGEDEGEGQGDEAGVDGDGGEEQGNHGAVEDFAAGVDVEVWGEEDDSGYADGEEEEPVGEDKEAEIRGVDGSEEGKWVEGGGEVERRERDPVVCRDVGRNLVLM